MGAPIPWQQIIEPVNRMLGNASENVGEPSLRINIVHLCRDDQAVHDRGSLAATVRAAEQPGLSPQGHCPFILPMSGRNWKSTTGIIHISAVRSWCVA
jgi:hypothetical protein